MVSHSGDGLEGIGGSNGNSDYELGGVFASDGKNGRLHSGSGGQSIVDEYGGSTIECGQWSAAAKAANSFSDGGEFASGVFREEFGVELRIRMEDFDAIFGDGPGGEFRISGVSNFANDKHIEWCTDSAGNFSSDGNATAGESEDGGESVQGE
jgi:hypothetical protein